jgi:hypothetical protein
MDNGIDLRQVAVHPVGVEDRASRFLPPRPNLVALPSQGVAWAITANFMPIVSWAIGSKLIRMLSPPITYLPKCDRYVLVVVRPGMLIRASQFSKISLSLILVSAIVHPAV